MLKMEILSVTDFCQENESEELFHKYKDKLKVNTDLTRALISFQANKVEPFYRWFKYKEGFSKDFVLYVLRLFADPKRQQTVLDPFSGIGTTLTVSHEAGFNAIGIELLPHAILTIKARRVAKHIERNLFMSAIDNLKNLDFKNEKIEKSWYFPHITITQGAFSNEAELEIANFRKFIFEQEQNEDIRTLLTLVGLSILEDASYTRKDGQYLRWDYRSLRKLKGKFDKGRIYEFKEKLFEKLNMIVSDLDTAPEIAPKGKFDLYEGSCLERLQGIPSSSVDLVITSPPYCNRYDYTRTYALELAFTGVTNETIKQLRQTLLSATVENRSKIQALSKSYASIGRLLEFESMVKVYDNQLALHQVLQRLRLEQEQLNNKNIISMIANYFFEMNIVIHELSRTLRHGGRVIMVNDNVQYNGYEVPVDLILSDFARSAGLETDVIWVLEKGKGNSSQQMGIHGRNEIRKCVYIWSKK